MLLRIALLVVFLASSTAAWAQWNEDAQECFEETKPETFHPDKALPFCERAIKSAELTKKNVGAMYYYRGTIWSSKRDYKRALEDYKQATELDPFLPQAHSNLGFTRFFLGDFKPAIFDFSHAYELKKDDPYAMLWLYIVLSRTGNDGRGNLKNITREVKFEEWPGPIVLMYLGQATPQAVLKDANDPVPARRREKQCEAYFYVGEQLLIEGKKAEAIKMLKAAVATNVTKFVEYEAARIELRRLTGGK
jgi:lipoprotein NlpI